MSVTLDDVLVTRNPASGAEVGSVAVTGPEIVAEIVDRARDAQAAWAARPWAERRKVLAEGWRILGRDARAWSDLIRDEIGKPATEAMAGDVIPTLDALRWTVKRSGRLLADERVGASWQRMLLMPAGRLRWAPYGVVGMIGTWNYPLFLNAAPIAQALAGGNAVVWKPSEMAIASGLKLQQSLEEAGAPPGLVAAVYGRGEVGRALLESKVDKVMFTGGVETGRRVLSTRAERATPASCSAASTATSPSCAPPTASPSPPRPPAACAAPAARSSCSCAAPPRSSRTSWRRSSRPSATRPGPTSTSDR